MARAFKENQTLTGASGGKLGAGGGAVSGIPARGNSTCKDVEVGRCRVLSGDSELLLAYAVAE